MNRRHYAPMNTSADRHYVLADAVPAFALRDIVLVVAYAALVGVLAQVVITLPFTPVPITGQTFGVLLGGMALGWRRALAGMAVYVALGLVGLPWFASGGGGFAVVRAPSFGYLIGFVVAAAVVGRLAEMRVDRNPVLTLGAMAAGTAIIYLFGVTWLMFAIHVDLAEGIALGLTPFLLGDAIKALLAAGLLPAAWKASGA
jgi:biotin transport system substrate-specific component